MPGSVPPEAGLGYDPDLRLQMSRMPGGAAAMVAVGSLEQHGAHLAVSTDTVIAHEVARRVCRACGYLLLPPVHYGVSFEHAPLFNASVGEAALAGMLADLADSLGAGGLGALFVVNGHHGNQGALARLCGRPRGRGLGGGGRREGRGARVLALSYWHFMDGPFDHAGLAETSLMLAAAGSGSAGGAGGAGGRGVRMSRARRGYVEPRGATDGEREEVSRRAAASFASVCPNGVWGDPRGASAARGRRLLGRIAAGVSDRCRKALSAAGAAGGPHEILYRGPPARRRVR